VILDEPTTEMRDVTPRASTTEEPSAEPPRHPWENGRD